MCVGFVLCVSFGNTCTCVYCVLYGLYCVFYCLVYVYVFLLVLSVLPPSDNSIAVNNNNNNNNNNLSRLVKTVSMSVVGVTYFRHGRSDRHYS
jgi:hypothetical protein